MSLIVVLRIPIFITNDYPSPDEEVTWYLLDFRRGNKGRGM